MAGIYHPRHPERTVLYRVPFHYFDKFLSEYKQRFESEYGYFRAVIQEVVKKYLDCGNPCSSFARIRCPDCRTEYLLTFSCKSRGFCPSCHAKRLEEWGKWMRKKLLLDFPHRQLGFSHLLEHELINPEMVQKILTWHHTGFNVHSKARAKTRREAERVGKYMIRPLLSLERLSSLRSTRSSVPNVRAR